MPINASDLRTFEQGFDASSESMAQKSRDDFVKIYPLSILEKLAIDDYVIGKGQPTFCTWVEAKTKLWANILGSTSAKFGIYYGRTKSDPTPQYRFTKKFGDPKNDTPERAFHNVLQALLALTKDGQEKNFKAIDSNPLSSLFKAKILSLYFPEKYASICSPEHLGVFAMELGLTDPSGLSEHFNSELQNLLIEEKQKHEISRAWSNFKFMIFLYTRYMPHHLNLEGGAEPTTLPLRGALRKILLGYGAAKEEEFTGHPMSDFLRHGLVESIKKGLVDPEEFSLQGSAGQSIWARSPWAAIFDLQITDTAQRGYYPAYLFREDMSGVYLSLNQGMTEIRDSYKSDAKDALRSRAEDFRARLGKTTGDFDVIDIDLKTSAAGNDAAFYEVGNIVAKFYPTNALPDEEILVSDLQKMIALYKRLIYGEPSLGEVQNLEDDEQDNPYFEDLRTLRVHKRIERNRGLAQKVKKLQGYVCRICNFDYEARYGKIGKEYIEAHHLEPISQLKGQRVQRDPAKDFIVLCANCHRMIHRSEFVDNPDAFREKYLIKKS